MKGLFFVLLGCATFYTEPLGRSQDLETVGNSLKLDLTDRIGVFKTQLCAKLPDDQAKRIKECKIDIVNSGDISRVRAFRQGGQERVEMSLGFSTLMYDVSRAMNYPLSPGEVISYLEYAFSKHRENASHLRNGEPTENILSSLEWSKVSKDARDAFSRDRPKQILVQQAWTGAILFVFAHEFAHHVLGHTTTPPLSLEASRNRESAADAWAADALTSIGIPPVTGTYPLLYFMVMDCDAVRHEDVRTHPADIRRFLALFEKIETSLDAIPMTGSISKEEAIRHVRKAKEMIKGEIEKGLGCLSSDFGLPHNSEGRELLNLINAAKLDFMGLRGAQLKADSDETTFAPKHLLIGALRGEIWIESKEGKSTLFLIMYEGEDRLEATNTFEKWAEIMKVSIPQISWERRNRTLKNGRSYVCENVSDNLYVGLRFIERQNNGYAVSLSMIHDRSE